MTNQNYEHRKETCLLQVMDDKGKALCGQKLRFTQKSSDFLFGVGGFDAVEVASGLESQDGNPLGASERSLLENTLEKLFGRSGFNNYATLPFYLGRYEAIEGQPDEARLKAAAQYFKERGVATKGHPLCWHTAWANWLMQYSTAEILQKALARIERDVSRFAGLIDRWDVINEVVIMPIFDKYDNAITGVCKEIGRVQMVKRVFEAARRANPQAELLLNDFNTSIDYEILIDGCLNAAAPIDVIGIQSHQHQGYWGREKLEEVLERFAHFGLPLHWTENTIISGALMPPEIIDLNDWQVKEWPSTAEGEERQKNELLEMYSILFAHPSVEAITTWSGTDRAWLNAPAGLIRSDNSEKPVYKALQDKILHDWRTNVELTTDSEGKVSFKGFRGAYTVASGDKQTDFDLNKDTDNTQWRNIWLS